MKKTRAGKVLKELRGSQTQLSLGLESNVTRESISKYENGRSQIPKDISQQIMRKYDDPRFAITIRQEYTSTGPQWLDGKNVDLHRCSVKEKTLEEIKEALNALEEVSLSKPLKFLEHYERQRVEIALEELVEAQTAIDMLVAIVCTESDISYTQVWLNHYSKLTRAGYIGGYS